ncbi:uncharacterized protein [Asterias amurensis]|uniref:uncharacterized protein n=1 Tax=Asterias amurensis TaxID=7602 RepID=UPI003AB38917
MSDDESSSVEGLLLCAKVGDIATFKKLLKEGDDVLQKDKDDRTVLHWAAQSGAVSIIMAGVTKGLAWHIDSKTKRGLTPLHDSCLAGNIRATHMLLALGADITTQTKEGYTPLLCAAGNGHCEVTRLLVGAGCDPNKLIPPIGVNAVHIATWTGQADVLEVLLQLGAKVDEKSKVGKTAMEFAEEQEHTECIETLQKYIAKTQSTPSALVDESKILKSKMKRAEDKIRTFFEDKLKEEIGYFEKQLQDQHEEDATLILKLQTEVSRLQTILGREQAQLVRGSPLRSRRSDIINLNRIPSSGSKRPTGITRQKRLSEGDETDKLSRQESSDSPESNNEEDRPEPSGVERVKSAKKKSMSTLVEESSRKTDSMTYLRKQGMDEGIPRAGSSGALNLPNKPLMSRRNRVISVDTPPTSPTILTPPECPFSAEMAPSTSNASTSRDNLQIVEVDAPRTRRKSLTMLLRPMFQFGDSNKGDRTRRRSVATTMPISPPKDTKPEKKSKGLSLLQRPLPGIQAVSEKAELSTQEFK